MRVLNAALDLGGFFRGIRLGARSVLLLDYDGTLAPFRERRDEARPYAGVSAILDDLLSARRVRTVIVSGRRAADVRRLLGVERSPEIWGSHGWERMGADGTHAVAAPGGDPELGLEEGARALDDTAFAGRRERKPASVALHWRGIPAQTAAAWRARAELAWTPIAERRGLLVREFDHGIELCARGRDKGSAVDAVLAEEAAGVPAAYLGDDLTDEDALRAIRGRGLGVLVREDLRPTAAALWIRPPEELLGFLRRWRDESGRAHD